MIKFNLIYLLIIIFLSTANADIFQKNKMLGKGINMGNMLEAPTEGAWGERLDTNYFKIIAEKGFQTVRIPIKWSTEERTAIDSPYTINETFFKRVDQVVNCALKNKLNVIINIHHYDTLFTNPTKEWNRFKAIWQQISTRYKDYSDSLYFEILNEPNTNLTPELWNQLISETFPIIRTTNPTRPVIIGVAEWGGVGALQKLVLPNDPNIILTIHYYSPMQFTHQGQSFVQGSSKWVGTKWSGTYFEKLAVVNDFDYARLYCQKHNLPVFLGEFGSGDVGDSTSRYNWTSFCARLFEKYGFSWAYWSFTTSFAAYDDYKKVWIDTIANALLSTDTSILAMPTNNLGTDLLKNGDFSDTTSWRFGVWDSSAEATGSINNQAFTISITKPGKASWVIQLMQSGINLQKNHSYALLFDAVADSERVISATVDQSDSAWANYGNNYNAMILTQKRTITVPFSMVTNDTNARVCFSFGGDTTSVHISNVHLYDLGLTTGIKQLRHNSSTGRLLYSRKMTNKSIILSFKNSIAQPISIFITNLNGRTIYKKNNVFIKSSDRLTIPLQKMSPSTLVLKVKGETFSTSEFIYNVE